MPPFGVAVKVTAVPRGCGATRSDVTITAETFVDGDVVGGGLVVVPDEVIGNAMWVETSSASAVAPALRTHTPMRKFGSAYAGVQS